MVFFNINLVFSFGTVFLISSLFLSNSGMSHVLYLIFNKLINVVLGKIRNDDISTCFYKPGTFILIQPETSQFIAGHPNGNTSPFAGFPYLHRTITECCNFSGGMIPRLYPGYDQGQSFWPLCLYHRQLRIFFLQKDDHIPDTLPPFSHPLHQCRLPDTV